MQTQVLVRFALSSALCALLACSHSTPSPALPTGAEGAAISVTTEEVTYTSGSTSLKGFIAYPATAEKRPGVLVVHEWWGLNDYVRSRAKQLAEMGYVAFAIDMYGEGKSTDHPEQAKEFMMAALANGPDSQNRFEAAQARLASDARVDAQKLAAIGYCFGGATVLNMARAANNELKLVASFHGSLGTGQPMPPSAFKGKIFVAHGAADPFVPPDVVAAFRQEMETAGAQYEFVEYAGAKHGFTNPAATAAGQANNLPLEYNAEADKASWARLTELLASL
jgi:dienelactone hydrolase